MEKLHRNRPRLVSNSRWLAYATAGAVTALNGNPSAEANIYHSGHLEC
jgi:hypothetical protein